jgi:hypothetical protein
VWLRYQTALVAAWLGTVPTLRAQTQPVAISYSAPQLNCARFWERAESSILTQSGGRGGEQTSGRRGVWRVRAQPDSDGVALEAWLDSLALWRRSKETTLRPDTDGLIGGRYRGILSRKGAYASQARPFIPDDVAEVAGMGTALDDFFPPLPPGPLRPGQAWRDSPSVTLRRMADSGLSGVPLYRFQITAGREIRSAPVAGDTGRIALRQRSQEHGTFVWHPSRGLLRWDRRIVVETTVAPGRSVRETVRSKIEQRITLLRDLSVPPSAGPACQ